MFRDKKINFLPTLMRCKNQDSSVWDLHHILFITVGETMELSSQPFQKLTKGCFLNLLAAKG